MYQKNTLNRQSLRIDFYLRKCPLKSFVWTKRSIMISNYMCTSVYTLSPLFCSKDPSLSMDILISVSKSIIQSEFSGYCYLKYVFMWLYVNLSVLHTCNNTNVNWLLKWYVCYLTVTVILCLGTVRKLSKHGTGAYWQVHLKKV